MIHVEHRPVYGSKESDEFICSCGWRGPAFAVAEHSENIAGEARATIERFGMLVETECGDDDWKRLDDLAGEAAFLSPLQFVIALRNQGFERN